MPILVRCTYCDQMAKQENCGYYKGVLVHNKPNYNCIQFAIKKTSLWRHLKGKDRVLPFLNKLTL